MFYNPHNLKICHDKTFTFHLKILMPISKIFFDPFSNFAVVPSNVNMGGKYYD